MRDANLPVIEQGDLVWFKDDSLLYVARVESVRTVLEGDPLAFQMFKLNIGDGGHSITRTRDSVQRHQVFRLPEERQRLINELEEDADRLKAYAETVCEDQDSETAPEIGLV